MKPIRKAVFPAAGLGTRFLPATKAMPKEMLPLVAKPLVGDEPFAVLLGDDIVDSETPATQQLIEVYEKYGAPVVGVIEIDGPEISRFGVVAGEEVEPGVVRITRMVEKPRYEEAP